MCGRTTCTVRWEDLEKEVAMATEVASPGKSRDLSPVPPVAGHLADSLPTILASGWRHDNRDVTVV